VSAARYKQRLLVIAGVVVLAGLACVVFSSARFQTLCCASEWRRYVEPNGNYEIVVYRLPQWFALPGSSGDARGVVRLVKKIQGRAKVEQSTEVEMIQTVSEPEWSPDRVVIKLIADWPLSP
jgi:hypothetical protein